MLNTRVACSVSVVRSVYFAPRLIFRRNSADTFRSRGNFDNKYCEFAPMATQTVVVVIMINYPNINFHSVHSAKNTAL